MEKVSKERKVFGFVYDRQETFLLEYNYARMRHWEKAAPDKNWLIKMIFCLIFVTSFTCGTELIDLVNARIHSRSTQTVQILPHLREITLLFTQHTHNTSHSNGAIFTCVLLLSPHLSCIYRILIRTTNSTYRTYFQHKCKWFKSCRSVGRSIFTSAWCLSICLKKKNTKRKIIGGNIF